MQRWSIGPESLPKQPIPLGMRELVRTGGVDTAVWAYGASSQDASGIIVMVHGFRGTHEGLAPIAAALARLRPELRVLVPDLPGFGETSALPGGNTIDGYAAWLRSLWAATSTSGGEATLLGHSFGSIVAAAAVAQGLSPERLVLVNPISQPALAGPRRVGSLAALAYYRLAKSLPERVARSLLSSPLIVRAMSEVMAKTHDAALRAWIHDQHARYFSVFGARAGLLGAFEASIRHDVTEYAWALTMPTLVIAGALDDIAPLSAQRQLVAQLPRATLAIASGVGHLVHYEAPEFAARCVVEFVVTRQGDNSACSERGRIS